MIEAWHGPFMVPEAASMQGSRCKVDLRQTPCAGWMGHWIAVQMDAASHHVPEARHVGHFQRVWLSSSVLSLGHRLGCCAAMF